LQREGLTRIILAVHYLAERFHEFLREYASRLPAVTIVEEPAPLGTGGALRHAAQRIGSSPFAALNGDSWVRQPLAAVVAEHVRKGSAFTMVVVRAEQVEGGARNKGEVSLGAHEELLGLSTADTVSSGWVNAGCYVLNRELVLGWPSGRYDLEPHLMSLVPPGRGYVVRSDESLLDIGTPDSYDMAGGVFPSLL
jgi:NDP-sugar pyrophosphorylase family protein